MTELDLRWTGVDAVRRRLVIETRSAGGYYRTVYRQGDDADEWIREGREIVAGVEAEIDDATDAARFMAI